MSPIQLESLVDLREKHGRNRYKRSIAIAALMTGTIVLGMLLISGAFRYQVLSIDPPGGLGAFETSLSVRPEFPVSNFLYERRSFRWFIGLTSQITLGGLAIFGVYTACLAVTGGLGAAACGAAAVGVVGAAFGIISAATGGGSTVDTSDLELGDMADVDYVQNGSKRDEDEHDHLGKVLREVFGQDYTFEGHVTGAHERHAHLIAMNKGRPVPVHSFTSAKGIRFHHAMIHSKEKNGLFHRFGFAPAAGDGTVSRRQTSAESSNEYFSSGGLDLFDCAATDSTQDHLTASDAGMMETLIQCNDPNFGNATELSIQVYDETTMGTIGAGMIAPFGSDGKSVISGETGTSNCPTGLPTDNSCPMEDN